MGTIIDMRKMPNEEAVFRLLIYCKATQELSNEAVSANKYLACELLSCKPLQRTMKLETIFLKFLQEHPDNVLIKDIDVLFNPEYEVDVLKTLLSVYKRKKFRLIWSGSYRDGCLIYSEEGRSDYKTYNINEYDIMCVI